MKLNHLSSKRAQFLTLLTMGASFWHNDKALWIAKPVVSHTEEEVMSLSVLNYCICAFLCSSHIFNPSLCHLLLFLLSCPVRCFFKALSELYPDRTSMICECRSFGWFEWLAMIGEWCPIQQALKLVHPNIPRNCWSPVGLEFWQATWPWNRDKRPD